MLRGAYTVLGILIVTCATCQSIELNIVNIRSQEGSIRLQFFDNEKNFDDKKPLFTKVVSKKSLQNGCIRVHYTGLKPGTYGIALLDDENGNEKMDYGLLLPKEGFGFSNYYHNRMTQPKFGDFSFVLNSETKQILLKIRYL